jgi:hypothetical protein
MEDQTEIEDPSDTLESEFQSLEGWIQTMKNSGDLLHHRLDSIERLLEQETFNFSKYVLKVSPIPPNEALNTLLKEMGIETRSFPLEEFLKALNRWLIQNELVDLNDLQIHLTPLLASAFQKSPELKKIPYPLLLISLPRMFE